MAQITSLAKVLNGLVRNYDFTGDELVFDSVRYGGLAGTLLTKAILDSLIANSHASGSDNQNIVAGSGLTGGGSGASVTLDVNVDNSTIEIVTDALQIKDAAISAAKLAASAITGQTAEAVADDADSILIYDNSATALKKMTRANFLAGTSTDEKVKVSANDTTAKYLEDAVVSANSLLTVSTLNDGGDEDLQLTVNQGNIDHGSIAGLGDDDHTQYHNDTRGDARYYQKSEFVTTATAGAPVKLDGAGKIAVAQLPSAVMTYEGVWNASTNTPTLADGVGDTGQVYRVSVAGTQNLGSGAITFDVGDYVIYNGTIWEKSDTTDAVASVNGQTGVVTVNAINELTGDVTAGPASGSQSQVATIAAGAVTSSKIAAGTIVDSNISASAAIALSKLAALTASRALVSDGSGVISASAVTSTELGYVSGVTSAIQTQLNGKASTALDNLAAVAINTDLLPGTADSIGLGSATKRWLNTHSTESVFYSGSSVSGRVSGAAGDLRISTPTNSVTQKVQIISGNASGGASGNIELNVGTATGTRGSVVLNGLQVDASNTKVVNVSDPTAAQDAATKNYVDNLGKVQKSMVAGEALAANTSFLVRFALTGETAGRVYKATNANAAADGKFWAIGIAIGTGQIAGDPVTVIMLGSHTLGASDSSFAAGDVGKPVWLTTAGGFSVTAPSGSGEAAFRIGSVEDTNKMFIDGKQLTGIN